MDQEYHVNGFNANQLKMIAIIAMTFDHLIWTMFPGTQKLWYVYALHVIGRLTAPIMWFFIAEGIHYTKNIRKYIERLLFFALISHFAYCFAFGIPLIGGNTGFFNRTSVMWPLALAVILVQIQNKNSLPKWIKIVSIPICCLLAFPADWSSIAVMAPFFLYYHRDNFKKQAWDIVLWTAVYASVYFLFLDKMYGILQMFTFLSIPFLSKYNGKRGAWKGMKWFFYAYYPLHLVLLGILRLLLYGNISTIF